MRREERVDSDSEEVRDSDRVDEGRRGACFPSDHRAAVHAECVRKLRLRHAAAEISKSLAVPVSCHADSVCRDNATFKGVTCRLCPTRPT